MNATEQHIRNLIQWLDAMPDPIDKDQDLGDADDAMATMQSLVFLTRSLLERHL